MIQVGSRPLGALVARLRLAPRVSGPGQAFGPMVRTAPAQSTYAPLACSSRGSASLVASSGLRPLGALLARLRLARRVWGIYFILDTQNRSGGEEDSVRARVSRYPRWNTNRIRGLRARPDGRARGSCHGCAASSPADASDRTSGGARRPPVYTKVHISWTGSVDRHDFVWDRCPRPSPVVGPVQASPWAGTGRRGGPVAAGGVGGQGLAARR